MPAPRWIARMNRHVTNRILGPFAPHIPGFGIIVHTGRKSGREYRTPVNLFRHNRGFIIALTYGPASEWVRNILASGRCVVETGGHTLRLEMPRLFRDERRSFVPSHIRFVLGLIRVNDFLEVSVDGTPTS